MPEGKGEPQVDTGEGAGAAVARAVQADERPERTILECVLRLLRTDEITLYCDYAGQPFIRLPGSSPSQACPIRSKRFRSWLARECYSQTGHLLLDREIDRIVNVVEGEAWERGHRDSVEPRVLELIEGEPVAEAVIQFMSRKTRYEELVTQFFDDLTKTAKRYRIIGRKGGRWPGAAWVLSRRLRKVMPLLRQLGIEVKIRHTNRGSLVTLTNARNARQGDACSVTASPRASPPNPSVPGQLEAGDGMDGQQDRAVVRGLLESMKATMPDTAGPCTSEDE